MTRVDPDLVKGGILGHMWLRGREYHSPLPGDLEPWYCFTKDGGHSILVTLPKHDNVEDGLVPAPVKTVLRHGWTVHPDGYIVADLPSDPVLGLIVPEEDDEFGDEDD